MTRYALVAGVLLALGLVGWAVWSLADSAPQDRRPRPAARDDSKAERRAPSNEPRARALPPASDGDSTGSASPRPSAPAKTAEQARADLQAVMDELEAIARRGETLPNDAWVERYKRGSDALQALVGALDPTDPAAQEEIGRSNADFRKALARVQKR